MSERDEIPNGLAKQIDDMEMEMAELTTKANNWRETALQLARNHGEAEADADRLATEYEATLREIGGVFWEEPGEWSPALIAHKNRKGIK